MSEPDKTDLYENDATAILMQFSDRIDRNGIALIAAALRAVETRAWNEAIEAAAKVADHWSNEWSKEWRRQFKVEEHLEGMSDGADEVATAIRSLRKEQP